MLSETTSFTAACETSRFGSVLRSELFAMEFESELRTRRRISSLAAVQAGAIDVLRYSGLGEQWGSRDESLIRDDGADYYVICAPTSARLTIQQNGCDADLHQGSFTIVSTSRPFRARIRPESEQRAFSAVHVRMPGPLVRRCIPNIDALCGREVPALPGSSRMMLSLFELALTEIPHLSGEGRTRFGRNLLEVFSQVAIPLASDDEAPRVSRGGARERTFRIARAFIAAQLSDPALDPRRVAEHCGVSTRFLHACFETLSDRSVAQTIRESRLDACRQALSNPALRQRTVIQIAGDWGFDDPAHFCRLYKAHFGRTPREERPPPARLSLHR